MPSAPRPGYALVRFDERGWGEDLQRCTPVARAAASAWRMTVERDHLLVASLYACRAEERDDTSLAACALCGHRHNRHYVVRLIMLSEPVVAFCLGGAAVSCRT